MEENITDANQKKYNFREIFASSHINFLFGSGVNGKAFKQLNNFVKTLEILKDVTGDGFEDKLNNANDELRATAIEKFCEEFNEFNIDVDNNNESIKHIKDLFMKVNKIIETTENRNSSMKKINVFTLNYDSIVEDSLNDLGYFNNIITVEKLEAIPIFDIIGYNIETERYIPTYCVAKLHGSVDKGKIKSSNIVYPGLNKYDKTLGADFFQVLFKMKSELMKFNSLLIIIGYSGLDKHINKLIGEAITNGLTVLWFKYDKDASDDIINEISSKIIIINPKESENKQDTTLTCFNLINSEVFLNGNR